MNQKRWIAAAALLVVFVILCLYGSLTAWNEWKGRQGYLGDREPLPGFGYCSSRQVRPCILSFHLNPEGGMVINVLTASLQDFYIKIKAEDGERVYECKRTGRYSNHVSCTGETLPVGETVSFLIVSKEKNVTLAEGSFPIIGMALATPDVYFTPTPIIFDHSPR